MLCHVEQWWPVAGHEHRVLEIVFLEWVASAEARDVLTSSNCDAIDKSRKHEANDHIQTS